MVSRSSNTKEITIQKLTALKTERVILFTCAFLMVIHLAASFFPHSRLWGINQLHYFPLEFRIVLSAIGLLISVPQINRMIAERLARVLAQAADRFKKINRYYKYAVVSLLSLIPFWLLRAKTPLLGDGYLRAGEMDIGKLISITEPLDFYLHLLVFKIFGLTGYTTYRVLSCIAGAVFLFLVLLICDLIGKGGKEKAFVFLILTSMGAGQLFFGYIESYTFQYVALTAYLFFAIRYLKQKSGFVWPCLFFLLAVSFHLSTLFLLPSLFYLGFARIPEEKGLKAKRFKFVNFMSLVYVIILMGVGLYLLKTLGSENSSKPFLIYPFGDGESFYSFFSLNHLLDFLNHQLLVSPVILVLWLVPIVFFRKVSNFKENVVKFLILTVIGSFAFALLVDPKLGYARDWDLFAFAGLGVTLLGAYLVVSIFTKEKTLELTGVTLILVATSFMFTLPWIGINASEEKSEARFEDLLRLDEKRAPGGYETLACYFRDKGEHEKTVELWKKAIAINPLTRYYVLLGNAYLRLKRYDDAITYYERFIQLSPNDINIDFVYRCLGVCLAGVERYDEAISNLKIAISLKPKEPGYYYTLGNILGKVRRYEEAVQCFEMDLNLDPNNVEIYKLLGISFAQLGNKAEAKRYLSSYLRLRPSEANQIEGILDSLDVETPPK